MPKTKSKQLSQEEVWDDSALLQSWDEALAEYKKYHSMQARGETVEDGVPATFTSQKATNSQDSSHSEPGETILQPPTADAPVEQHSDKDASTILPPGRSADGDGPPSTPVRGRAEQPAVPEMLIHTVKDDALRNLMISWYYAGYYTGLFEGQQSTQVSKRGES